MNDLIVNNAGSPGSTKLHSETVAQYKINGQTVDVDLCWQGEVSDLDKDRFYDFYDENGVCLNEGQPWHDDNNGVPSYVEVKEMFDSLA